MRCEDNASVLFVGMVGGYLCGLTPVIMKALFTTLTGLIALILCSCGPDQAPRQRDVVSTASFAASLDQDTANYVPLYLHPIPFEEELNAPQSSFGGYGQVLAPPMDKFQAQVLNSGTWVYEFYVDSQASLGQRQAGTGQWLEFRPDGTFVGGHWDRQTHSGAYYLNLQGEYPRLTLDSNVDRLDADWDIQGTTAEQDQMSWRRVTDSKFGPYRKSVLCKMMKMDGRPTKKQFANLYRGNPQQW